MTKPVREKVRKLRDKGLSLRQIAKKVGLASPSTVLFHLKRKDYRFYLAEQELLELRGFIPETHKLYKKFKLNQFQEAK